jgi:hypothetical protein
MIFFSFRSCTAATAIIFGCSLVVVTFYVLDNLDDVDCVVYLYMWPVWPREAASYLSSTPLLG